MNAIDFKAIWRDSGAMLSAPDIYAFERLESPPDLFPFVTTFFVFRSRQRLISDVQPANTGHMMVFLKGQGEARFFNGNIQANQPVTVVANTNAAMQYLVEGPFTCIDGCFSPLGWRLITGLPADSSSDRFVDSGQIFGDSVHLFHNHMVEIENAHIPEAEKNQQLLDNMIIFLKKYIGRANQKHAEIISLVSQWLDASLAPNLDELYSQLPVSKRQAQRIIKGYFGCAPKLLMRKYRALRAAMILNDQNCSNAEQNAVKDLFYDQPHMIREIRHFAGRTPRLIADGHDETLLSMWLEKENLRELKQ